MPRPNKISLRVQYNHLPILKHFNNHKQALTITKDLKAIIAKCSRTKAIEII